MTDITERLRRLYVQDGTNYVQEAADLIDKLRAELDYAVEQAARNADEVLALRERVTHLEQLVTDATYTLQQARIWRHGGRNSYATGKED
jgi:hypothetical protein